MVSTAEGGTKRAWADGPFELISISSLGYEPGEKIQPYHLMAAEMIIVHNCLIRGINSVYLQCVNVERSPADVPAFVDYAIAWSQILQRHHTTEEKWVFPEIEAIIGEKGAMDVNVQQHHAFERGIDEYTMYLQDTKTGKERYDGAKLKTIIDSFMPVLRRHLQEEIYTLKALDQYEEKADWAKWTKDTAAAVVKASQTAEGMIIELPFMVHNHEAAFEMVGTWPPIPSVVFFILKWVYFRRNSKWWHFAPCDNSGKARDLPYAL